MSAQSGPPAPTNGPEYPSPPPTSTGPQAMGQPAGPGLRSADGRWEWDGQAWRPVPPPGAVPGTGFPPGFSAAPTVGRGGSGTAIASLVLGIVAMIAWLVPIAGLPVSVTGIVFGVLGRNSPGRRMAIWGIVLASIALVLTLINFGLGAYLSVRRNMGTG